MHSRLRPSAASSLKRCAARWLRPYVRWCRAAPRWESSSMNAPIRMAGAEGLLDRAADFPILSHPIKGRRLAYLDNGATTQKPLAVIQAESHFYERSNANIHRG